MTARVIVIGGGLAGSEAAWQAARQGMEVDLFEMRPQRQTPAHHTDKLAELVCSNSLGSRFLHGAGGLLKEEMRRLDSLVISCADGAMVPAGGALAVDRDRFAGAVTEALAACPGIRIHRQEVQEFPQDAPTVVATGPLTSPALAEAIQDLTGGDDLYFYDAAAPIVTLESVDQEAGFWASRYGRGDDDYFNCPLSEEEYQVFWEALVSAERHEGHIDEELVFFEGCMPVEEGADRGRDTLRFGPMKPVGLTDPRTGRRPYAVVQLRRENRPTTLLNLVGFQTRMKWGEQKRVFRLIPALREADFVRYGVMHRNTFVNSPAVLHPTYQVRNTPHLFLAGQMTGVEGYVESAAAGLIAGRNAARMARGETPVALPRDTMMGALAHYITTANPQHFQPMNSNFGLLMPLDNPPRDKKERKQAMADRALAALDEFLRTHGETSKERHSQVSEVQG